MIGFDGSPGLAAQLEAGLARLVTVFPEHLAKPTPPAPFEPHQAARNDQFDAIVRAHKRDRLALPIQALIWTGAPHHGFEQMHLRRLAWFVPTMLAAWLERRIGANDLRFGPDDLERILGSTIEVEGWLPWTQEEYDALQAFFAIAIDAALATALPPAQPSRRPLEDGIAVWSDHGPSVPLEVLRVARMLELPREPLVARWVAEPSLDHLLEGVLDPTTSAKHVLAEEAVADRLGEAFFSASGERALRISKAEKNVRRWIARRDEF